MDEPTALAAHQAATDTCPRCGSEVADAWLVCGWCGEPIAAAAELPAGSRLADGRYQVLGVIGRGGFGITYEAGDRRLERRVALKELFPESAVRHGSVVLTPPQGRAAFRDARDRFLREARVLARFSHPGIVRVFEVFEEHGTAYLVMELLDGCTLVDLLRQRGKPFTEAEVLDVAGRVAAALRPVHVAGVLHRDVNPSNVMLTTHGRIVVIDFGLARAFEADHTVGMTRVVTPGYAPLEQYRGEGRFGPFTDVYGLAATCYRLATGRVPVAAVERDGGEPIPSPRELNPAISKPVSDAILDGLELEPSHRPQDLDSLLARLGIRRLPDGPRSMLLDGGFDLAAPTAVAEGAPWHEPAGSRSEGPTRPTAAPAPAPAPAPGFAPPPLTVSAAVPGSEARLPIAVGPGHPGRRKITIPLFAILLAVGLAAPVLAAILVVLVAVPWLATLGDSVAHRLRADHGVPGGWAERRLSPGALAPTRFVRNLVLSVVRSSPIIGIGAVLLGAWFALERTTLSQGVLYGSLRVIGGLVVGLVLVTAREGSARFRTGMGLDEVVRRLVPDGRTSERVVACWILAVVFLALALWLTPSTFPIP